MAASLSALTLTAAEAESNSRHGCWTVLMRSSCKLRSMQPSAALYHGLCTHALLSQTCCTGGCTSICYT
jgi:hypothetical protein